jgi:hypothetical protein
MNRFVGCVVAAVHVRPLSVERNTPSAVPAKSVVPLAAREWMVEYVGSGVAGVQVRPSSVERNTTASSVPAKSVVPLAMSDRMLKGPTVRRRGCLVAAVQVRPPSVERKTRESVAANRVVPLLVRAQQVPCPGSP